MGTMCKKPHESTEMEYVVLKATCDLFDVDEDKRDALRIYSVGSSRLSFTRLTSGHASLIKKNKTRDSN